MKNRMRKVTLVYCPNGTEYPYWAERGYARIGPKYVHFKPDDEDGWAIERKIEREKCIVVDGWHNEVIKDVEEFQRALREREERRTSFLRNLESELTDIRLKRVEEWSKANPYPVFKLNIKSRILASG
jgi:hypothetical protein